MSRGWNSGPSIYEATLLVIYRVRSLMPDVMPMWLTVTRLEESTYSLEYRPTCITNVLHTTPRK
jgi:hypothetical protein